MSERIEDKEEVKSYIKGEKNSKQISDLIDDTLKHHHKVWLASDWHLFVRNKKGGRECHPRLNYDKVIKNISKADPEDLLIYLGDLTDGEYKNRSHLKEVLLQLPPKNKVLVRGNNDTFSDDFYKECGFKYVTYKFVWNDILFSHPPLEHKHSMNIHGHKHFNYKTMHKKDTYWVPYNNHICVFKELGELQELKDVMKQLPEFKKHIQEDHDKIDELRERNEKAKDNKHIFEQAIISFLYEYNDPEDYDEYWR